MAAFIGRRLALAALVILGTLTLVFITGHAIGDPARISLPITATAEQVTQRQVDLGLDRPLLTQYFSFMSHALRGDFGDSLFYRSSAIDVAIARLPRTLYLTVVTLFLAVPIAVLLGCWAALRPRSVVGRLLTVASSISISIVEFWVALMLIFVVAAQMGLLPTSGYGGLEYALLPALALALRPFGRLSQVTRSSVEFELKRTYVKAARAKGLSEARVTRHALRNASIPIVAMSGEEVIALLSGAVVVETIFAWPGLGELLIESIQRRDLTLLEATVFLIAVLVCLVNLAADAVYIYLDPRVKVS
jgi:peptide/nickel transport system permease protein